MTLWVQKSAKYAMKKINLHYIKVYTVVLTFIQTLETVLHVTTQIRG